MLKKIRINVSQLIKFKIFLWLFPLEVSPLIIPLYFFLLPFDFYEQDASIFFMWYAAHIIILGKTDAKLGNINIKKKWAQLQESSIMTHHYHEFQL